MNFRFVVNSTVRFYRKTVPPCVESLRAAGIDDILVIVGGSTPKHIIETGVEYIFVPYDNFDLTSFNYIAEQETISNVFYIHDTCKAGPNFKKRLAALNIDEKMCAKLVCDGLSMNMGYYPFGLIKAREKELVEVKNFDFTEEGIVKAKLVALRFEDFILKHHRTRALATEARVTSTNSTPYEGSVRLQEYYPSLDFYKYKANYNLAIHPLRVDL
jgi:hypothetical protein